MEQCYESCLSWHSYLDSSLDVSDNVFINDAASTTVAVFNETQDGNGDTVPATITDNTLYSFNPSNLNDDAYGPPFDTASNNVFLPGPGPALDTSPGYDVSEPASVALLLVATLAIATVRGMLVVALWRKGVRPFRTLWRELTAVRATA